MLREYDNARIRASIGGYRRYIAILPMAGIPGNHLAALNAERNAVEDLCSLVMLLVDHYQGTYHMAFKIQWFALVVEHFKKLHTLVEYLHTAPYNVNPRISDYSCPPDDKPYDLHGLMRNLIAGRNRYVTIEESLTVGPNYPMIPGPYHEKVLRVCRAIKGLLDVGSLLVNNYDGVFQRSIKSHIYDLLLQQSHEFNDLTIPEVTALSSRS